MYSKQNLLEMKLQIIFIIMITLLVIIEPSIFLFKILKFIIKMYI